METLLAILLALDLLIDDHAGTIVRLAQLLTVVRVVELVASVAIVALTAMAG